MKDRVLIKTISEECANFFYLESLSGYVICYKYTFCDLDRNKCILVQSIIKLKCWPILYL